MTAKEPTQAPAGATRTLNASDAAALRAWMSRWKLISEMTAGLLRATSLTEKLRQLGALYEAPGDWAGTAALGTETEVVRRVWKTWRERWRG